MIISTVVTAQNFKGYDDSFSYHEKDEVKKDGYTYATNIEWGFKKKPVLTFS
jgi:hypothetical protein